MKQSLFTITITEKHEWIAQSMKITWKNWTERWNVRRDTFFFCRQCPVLTTYGSKPFESCFFFCPQTQFHSPSRDLDNKAEVQKMTGKYFHLNILHLHYTWIHDFNHVNHLKLNWLFSEDITRKILDQFAWNLQDC